MNRYRKGTKVDISIEYTGSIWTVTINGLGYGWTSTLEEALSKAADYEADIRGEMSRRKAGA